jgi:hypothetical protein
MKYAQLQYLFNAKMNKKILIIIILGVICVIAGIVFFSKILSSEKMIIMSGGLLGNSFKQGQYASINSYIPNPSLNYYNVTLDNGLKISYKGYEITYRMGFEMTNGQRYAWNQIPSSIGKNLWVTEVSPSKYKYGVDFWNVSDNIRSNLKYVILHRVNATKTNVTGTYPMTLSDIQGRIVVQDGNIIINDDVVMSHDDILSTYDIALINRSEIIIGNLNNSWEVCDTWDADYINCATSHIEYNWINNGDGTWNITFDPTITLDGGDVVSTSILTNTTAETGNANFTHLNLSNTNPYDRIAGYWNFDGDLENIKLTTHYDFSKNGNDGTGVLDVISNSTNCLDNFGSCGYFNGSIGNQVSIPESPSVNITGNLSASFWFNPVVTSSSLVDGEGIIEKRIDGAITYRIFHNPIADSIRFTLNADSQINCDGTTDLQGGTWYYVATTYNGTAQSVYINGVSEGNCSNTGAIASNNDTLCFGAINCNTNPLDGLLDEIMIFNTSLTPQQVLDIYNNQSARFIPIGEQELNNQSVLNISSGYDRVNVSTIIKNNFSSQINLTIGFYNGSWQSTLPQVVVSNTNITFNISITTTNLTLNYTLIAGNSTNNPFYSPIIQNDIVVETWNSGEIIYNLEITNPTTASPVSVSGLDNISINFNFQGNGTNLTSGVTMDNVTIGGNLCNILTDETCNGTNSSCSVFINQSYCEEASCSWSGGGGGGESIVFAENFETTLANWSNVGFTLEASPARGTQSAGCLATVNCDSHVNQSVNTTGADSVNVSIWFNVDDTEPADCYVYFNSSSSGWVQMQSCDQTAIPGCAGDDTWCQLKINSTDSQYLHSNFSVRVWADPDNNENVWMDDIQINITTSGAASCSGTSQACEDYNKTTCGYDTGCSYINKTQFTFLAGIGWQVNVTVPNGLSGLQDLFLNATYSGTTRNDTQLNAINYGAASNQCNCTSISCNLNCSKSCNVTTVNLQGGNFSTYGSGIITLLGNITNYTRKTFNGTSVANKCIIRGTNGWFR